MRDFSINSEAKKTKLFDLEDRELTELQLKQEKIINKNLQKILKFEGVSSL